VENQNPRRAKNGKNQTFSNVQIKWGKLGVGGAGEGKGRSTNTKRGGNREKIQIINRFDTEKKG